MLRIFLSLGNIVFSLILGALAFGFVFLKYPETMSSLLDMAAGFKTWLSSRGLSTEYNNWMRVLLDERQLVFMGFTVFMRLLLSLVAWPITAAFSRAA